MGRRSDENYHRVMRPSSNNLGLGGSKRRALDSINANVIGAAPYPCAVHKRGVFTEKSSIPVHRPVTRNFAEQLTAKEKRPSLKRETKAQVQPVLSKNQTKDCIFVYEDDDKTMDVPMFERIDRMDSDEVEMEDIEDPVLDIDSGDKKNPLAVTHYIDDIYTFYKKTENLSCVSPYYMSKQSDINERMRGILIDWLIEVHYKFELMDETLYLTVNLIDRFLSVQSVVRKKLQLVGVTALLLASKYEEVSVPVVDDLILISDKAYNRKEVLDMEKMMVNALQFNMSVPTPYVFMRRFLKAAQADKKLELLSHFLIELCLVEYEMLRFPPSLLAAAAIFTAQCTFSGHKEWSKTSVYHTNYTEDQLMECAKHMVHYHEKAGNGKLTGVHKKYSTTKYGYAARVEPAIFLINDEF